LVIVHRMAAIRLGFGALYAALNDGAPKTFSMGFADGTLWVLRPFIQFILPIVVSVETRNSRAVVELIRRFSVRLADEAVGADTRDTAAELSSLRDDANSLAALMAPGSNATVRQVLKFVHGRKLMTLDQRILAHTEETGPIEAVDPSPSATSTAVPPDLETLSAAMYAYMECRAAQLRNYSTYLEAKSPFSTQHGVKGSEFERVLVVLDDEEGSFSLYSYEKLFGVKPLSPADVKNQEQKKDSVVERTRRLLYVCCSRAVKDLAVVFFASDEALAKTCALERGWFEANSVFSSEDLA